MKADLKTVSEKEFDDYMELRDKVLEVLEGHNIRIILPMLTALLAETAFETGVELEEALKAVVTGITMKYAIEMPDEDSPIH